MTSLDIFPQCPGAKHALDLRTAVQRTLHHSRSHGTRWCLLERVLDLVGRRLTSVQSCFGRKIRQKWPAVSYGLVEEAGINTRML